MVSEYLHCRKNPMCSAYSFPPPTNPYLFICLFICIFIHSCVHLAAARGILVPWPGIEPSPPAVEAWSLNHWTTREVPTPHIYTVSKVLTFPECHIVGITQYVAFSDWLLPLRSMHLRFLHVFFFFRSEFIYLFIHSFIWLCQVLVVARKIFTAPCGIFSCIM